MPSDDNDMFYFKDVHKQYKVPFVVYADFKSILIPCIQENFSDNALYTQKTHEHQASGFCYIIVSDVEDFNTPPVVYRGENAVEKILECINKLIRRKYSRVFGLSLLVEDRTFTCTCKKRLTANCRGHVIFEDVLHLQKSNLIIFSLFSILYGADTLEQTI